MAFNAHCHPHDTRQNKSPRHTAPVHKNIIIISRNITQPLYLFHYFKQLCIVFDKNKNVIFSFVVNCYHLHFKLFQKFLLLHYITHMHLADAFIQSDLQCIQAIHLYC